MRRSISMVFGLIACGCSGEGSPTDLDDSINDMTDQSDSGTDTADTGKALDADGDGVPASHDCDDANSAIYPGAPELCDGLDNDCDSRVDEVTAASTAGQAFSTVDDAVAVALSADAPATVRVCAAKRFWEVAPIEVSGGRSLTIVGAGAATDTTLVPAYAAMVMSVQDTSTLALESLTITGSATVGAPAIEAVGSAILSMNNVVVRDNDGPAIKIVGDKKAATGVRGSFTGVDITGNGFFSAIAGGIYALHSFELTLSNVTINDNLALDGGGIYAAAGAGKSTIVMDQAEVSGNRTGGYNGGGLYLSAETSGSLVVELRDCTISDNDASFGGGMLVAGAIVQGYGASSVHDNGATRGAAIGLYSGTVSGLTIQDTRAQEGSGIYVGAGTSPVVLSDLVLDNNVADEGVALYISKGREVSLSDTSITRNQADVEGGAAVYVDLGEAEDGTSLRAINVDWGTPKLDDNDTPDLRAAGPDHSYSLDGLVSNVTCTSKSAECVVPKP